MNEMYPCINRNAKPNNNQLITYYKRVSYLLRIHTLTITGSNKFCSPCIVANFCLGKEFFHLSFFYPFSVIRNTTDFYQNRLLSCNKINSQRPTICQYKSEISYKYLLWTICCQIIHSVVTLARLLYLCCTSCGSFSRLQ